MLLYPTDWRAVSPTTVNDYYRALHTFFNWLQHGEFIKDNPLRHIKTPKVDKKVGAGAQSKGVEKLLNACTAKKAMDVRK